MARVANIPYCFPRNGSNGSEMTRSQWEKRKNFLNKKETITGGPVDSKFLVDENRIPIFKEIMALGEKISGQKARLIFTGHGTGGAYAVLMAFSVATFEMAGGFKMFQWPSLTIEVITFGQPRIGNSKNAEMIYKRKNRVKIYRVTNGNDYVSQFPKISNDGIQYWHTETEYWIPGIEDCDCSSITGEKDKNGLYKVYECPGFFPNAQKKFGENMDCNLGKDPGQNRLSNAAHFGPWFGTTFGDCQHFYPT
ncbi:hypothetical protein G9A89_002872 [Geosiphon pyriformis]|nr:hypothetical protein G9A89_002872 [Geosiphon pyriformis]